MKIRNGFVSNSSSSSYVIKVLNKNNINTLLSSIKNSIEPCTEIIDINELISSNIYIANKHLLKDYHGKIYFCQFIEEIYYVMLQNENIIKMINNKDELYYINIDYNEKKVRDLFDMFLKNNFIKIILHDDDIYNII